MPDLAHRFTYHPPTTGQRIRDHEFARDRVGAVAQELDKVLPEGREKALVMTKLEEALFWSNAAIAREV